MNNEECCEILRAYMKNISRSNDPVLERCVYELLNYLKGPELNKIWSALPNRFRNDVRLIIKLPCSEHYNSEQGQTNEPSVPRYLCCERLTISNQVSL